MSNLTDFDIIGYGEYEPTARITCNVCLWSDTDRGYGYNLGALVQLAKEHVHA